MSTSLDTTIAFIGGGNMASAIIGGLVRQGLPAARVQVVEPFAETRAKLLADHGVQALEQAGPALADAGLVVWAVKPQVFAEAAAPVRAHAAGALHLSVAAGIRSDSIARWLGSERIVRAMPNTPALVGLGMTGLFARDAVSAADRAQIEQVIATTGAALWVGQEAHLDAVTALSGSGPAYVFYFLEAMVQAGTGMGLSAAQAQQLAIGTFAGAAELARRSDEPLATLRQRVTSKGGTTYAAITSMQEAGVGPAFERAMQAAEQRARELGDEFGKA
ncbi:pyrroline-5-carboxylate reductase [Pseudorhodoferax sp. Leaf265]|uniref:pyrroline-5-carboxylate reductase n=1 Tax=Pseudorhodoferax sp. Leaf265 TaxID=1736315 RepID=UPI0006FA9428|nr:pyrroline-5-carboxylate reductase [Pseudorhodoferax sp. Leaf265]KQP03835.1 pyrroline-5-carboxylate reductase [Pseudorhodoferax sp. Leaf265]